MRTPHAAATAGASRQPDVGAPMRSTDDKQLSKRRWIVSADDHILEPPDIFVGRLASRFHDVEPRLVALDAEEVWIVGDRSIGVSRLANVAGEPCEEFRDSGIVLAEV